MLRDFPSPPREKQPGPRRRWGPTRLTGRILLLVGLAAGVSSIGRPTESSPSSNRYGTPVLRGTLSDQAIVESSGLAASKRGELAVFWTHNDSGDLPRLFAVDDAGRSLGACRVVNATAVDWEDMASFSRDGSTWLAIGDMGDNSRRRPTCRLWWCREPSASATETTAGGLEFRYEDGPRDCEALAVDPSRNVILLATKTWQDCQIYELPLPPDLTRVLPELAVARRIATIAVPMVVAMDVSRDGQRAVLLTYGDAFEFDCREDEAWRAGFAKPSTRIAMPARRQGESICYGVDGRSLFLTSERLPTPLWEVPPKP